MPPRTTSYMDATAISTADKRVYPDSDGVPRRSSSTATAYYVQAPPQQQGQRSPPPPGPQQQLLLQRQHQQCYQYHYQHQYQQHQHQQHGLQQYQHYQQQPQTYQRRQDPAAQQQFTLRAAALTQPSSYQSQPQQGPLPPQHSLPRSQQQRLQLAVQQDEQALEDVVQQMMGTAGCGGGGGGSSRNSAGALCDEYGGGGGGGLAGRDAAQLTGLPAAAPLPPWGREDGGRPNDGGGVIGAGVGVGPAPCVPVAEGVARIYAEEIERMWLETGAGRVSEKGYGPDKGQVPARSADARSTNSSPSLRLSPEHHNSLSEVLGLELMAEPEGRSDAEALFQVPGVRHGNSSKGAGNAASLAAGEQMGHRGDPGYWTQQPLGVMMMVGGQHYPHNPYDAQPGARRPSRCGEQARAEPRQAQQHQQQPPQQQRHQQHQQYGYYPVQEQQHHQYNHQQQQAQQRQPLRNAVQPGLHAALHHRPSEFNLADNRAVTAAAGASASASGGRSGFMPAPRQHPSAEGLKPAAGAAAAAAATATVKAAESPGGSRRPARRIRPPTGLRDFVMSEVSGFGGEEGDSDGDGDGDGGWKGVAQGGLGMKGRVPRCEGSSFSRGSSAQGSGMNRGSGGGLGGRAEVGLGLRVAAPSASPHARVGAGAGAAVGAGASAGPSRKGIGRPKGARKASDEQAATTAGTAKHERSADATASVAGAAVAAAAPARRPPARLRPAGASGYAAEEVGAPGGAFWAADGQAPKRRQRYRLLSELVVVLPEVKPGEAAGAGAAVGYGAQGGAQGLRAGGREGAVLGGGGAAAAAVEFRGGAGASGPLWGRGGDCAAASLPAATATACDSGAPRMLSVRDCRAPLPSAPEVALFTVGSSAGLGYSELVATGGEACAAGSASAGQAPPLANARAAAAAMPRRLALPSGAELATQLTAGFAAACQAPAGATQRSGAYGCGGQEAGRQRLPAAAAALGPADVVLLDLTASTVRLPGLSPTAEDSAVHQPAAPSGREYGYGCGYARCFGDGDGYDDGYADAFLDGPD